jgi:hypothetical protein
MKSEAFGLPKLIARSQPAVVAVPGILLSYSALLSSVVTLGPVPKVCGTIVLKSEAGTLSRVESLF